MTLDNTAYMGILLSFDQSKKHSVSTEIASDTRDGASGSRPLYAEVELGRKGPIISLLASHMDEGSLASKELQVVIPMLSQATLSI